MDYPGRWHAPKNYPSPLSFYDTQEYWREFFIKVRISPNFGNVRSEVPNSWVLILSQSMMQRNANYSNNGKEQELHSSLTIISIHSGISRKPAQTWEELLSHEVSILIIKLPESPLASLYKCQKFSNNLMFKRLGLGWHCQCLYPQRRSQLLSQTPIIQGCVGFCSDIVVK